MIILLFGRKLEAAYENLRQLSILDALTGIPNRRYFTERISEEFDRSRREKMPLSLIICDIDHFKKYNDTYGHEPGDECLKQVAQTIDKMLRRPGDFCARYGGEEFVIILPNTHGEGALEVAERLRLRVENLNIEHKASSSHNSVTISLGLATDYASNPSYEEVIRKADEALYRAKANGRNRVECFTETESE